MTPNILRKIALSIPDATEGFHMGHPNFRINGKIFATMCSPDDRWGMVKVPIALQRKLIKSKPAGFVPASGAWGKQGSTLVLLAKVDAATLQPVIKAAAQNAVVKKAWRTQAHPRSL
ncbi:MAG TPA: MmcQ/YjbR family DNA-binding protein [Candidatus Eremiobacteraceae bacterium]|nr:MmcQ/YjbR family DNA-binding protein [Candidatus Eremiobacteraceae bacterium]